MRILKMKRKIKEEAQTKVYEKYLEYMKKAKKYHLEGAVIDGLRYECMAEAYFEGASDMLKEIEVYQRISGQ